MSNSFAFIVMLTAARDIMSSRTNESAEVIGGNSSLAGFCEVSLLRCFMKVADAPESVFWNLI
jgi:hypothetical protein